VVVTITILFNIKANGITKHENTMQKRKYYVAVLALLILIAGCTSEENIDQGETEWQQLFNGQNLSNWDKYLGTSLGSEFDHLAEDAIPEQVFSVVEEEGEPAIRITGEINGSLATEESFENYHLRMDFKWGETVYSTRNSGLLYHSFGDFGESLGTWMPNIEFQMWTDNLGDTYLMGNTTTQTEVTREADEFIYTPGEELLTFGEDDHGRLIRKNLDNEAPLGEWNTIELYTYGRTAVHVVNGVVVKVNQNTGTYENGTIEPLTSGKIQIQSEGGELFIRNVDIRQIDEIPHSILP